MRKQKSEVRSQRNKYRIQIVLVCVLFSVLCSPAAFGSEKWSGIDVSVVEKVAKEHGREAVTPIINTNQGDLLLFIFLLSGTIGGFAAGYYWRILMVEKVSEINRDKQDITA